MKKNLFKSSVYLFLTILLFAVVYESYSRAGGGGHGGGGFGGGSHVHGHGHGHYSPLSIFVMIVIWAGSTIVTIVTTILLINKRNKARRNAKVSAEEDRLWDFQQMQKRVEAIFMKVQHAWHKRNQDLARNDMSEKIYNKHKQQTDELIRQKRINVLKDIRVRKIMIYSVEDYQDNSKDRFAAHISASMIDFTISEVNPHTLIGDPDEAEKFTEIWKFVRKDKQWVLDEIDAEVSIFDILYGKAVKE